MIKIKKYLSGVNLLVLELIILFQLISYMPIAINYFRAPVGSYYFGETDYPIDMLGNLEIVRDGYLGHWGRINKITSWPQELPWLFKFEYILLGQIARLLHTEPLIAYKISVIIVSIVTLLFFYWFLTKVFIKKNERLTAFSLVLFGSSIYVPVTNLESPLRSLDVIGGGGLIFQRFTRDAPHYLLGDIFSLLSIYFFTKTLGKSHKDRNLFAMICSCLLTTIFFAPDMFLLLITLLIFLIYKSISLLKEKKKFYSINKLLVVAGFYVMSAIAPIEYLLFLQSNVAKSEDVIMFHLGIFGYILVVGLVLPLAILSIFRILKRKDDLLVMLFCFLPAHFLAFIFMQKINLFSIRRLFQTPYIVIFAILATIGINVVVSFTQKIKLQFFRHMRLIIILIIFISSLFSYQTSLRISFNCFCLKMVYSYGYPKKELMEAIWYLRDHSSENDIVISDLNNGLLIPSFAGNKVYANWWMRLAEPPQLGKVWGNIGRFFSGEMSQEEAKIFLENNQIKYVFYSEEEKSYSHQRVLPYVFLQKVYQKDNTIVFSTTKS